MPTWEIQRIVATVAATVGDEDYPSKVTLTIDTQTFEPFPANGRQVIIEYVWLDED